MALSVTEFGFYNAAAMLGYKELAGKLNEDEGGGTIRAG